jgi:hypothetical protein
MTEGLAGADFLCGGWKWDPAMRELRHYPRRGRRGFAAEPDAVEQLQPARTLTVHRWSQPPMQTSTGEMTSPRHARILLKYEDGRELEINEDDRVCAEKLVATLAEACGLEPAWLGAPGGWHRGNLPERDDMGRLTYKGRCAHRCRHSARPSSEDRSAHQPIPRLTYKGGCADRCQDSARPRQGARSADLIWSSRGISVACRTGRWNWQPAR